MPVTLQLFFEGNLFRLAYQLRKSVRGLDGVREARLRVEVKAFVEPGSEDRRQFGSLVKSVSSPYWYPLNRLEALSREQCPNQRAAQKNVLLKWCSPCALADILRNAHTRGHQF